MSQILRTRQSASLQADDRNYDQIQILFCFARLLIGTTFVLIGSSFAFSVSERIVPQRHTDAHKNSIRIFVVRFISLLPGETNAANIGNCKYRCRAHRPNGAGLHSRQRFRIQ